MQDVTSDSDPGGVAILAIRLAATSREKNSSSLA